MAEAPHAAEHRHRRRRWRLAADRRLGRGDRRCRLGIGSAVRDHLLLDPTAFLGAVALPERRIRGGWRPDAAGRRRAARNQAPDAALYVDAVAGDAGAVPARNGGTAIWRRRLRTQHSVHRDFRQSVARGRRGRRTQRAVYVPFLATVPVSDLRHAARGPRRGNGMTTRGMITVGDGTMDQRQRRIRARNRALLAVLLALVALF